MDVDDENVTETGFLPTLPGESTRISGALALFRVSRVLNNVLEDLYPSRSGYDVYTSKMRSVAAQLDEWLQNLPPHLRLEFTQDKPSTNVTSSRSPLLSLVYYFTRSLIHRPAVCFAEENVRSPSILALSDSSKHIIQILELLDERRLCLSFSINRKELVLFSGLGLLWQILGVKRDSKLARESQKLLTTVIEQLESESPAAAAEFGTLANTLVSLDNPKCGNATTGQGSTDMSAPTQKPSKSPKKQSPKARLTGSANRDQSMQVPPSRRNTISGATPPVAASSLRSPSWQSLPSSQVDQYSAPPCYTDRGRSSLDLDADGRLASSSVGYDLPRAISCSTPSDANAGAITMADWEYVLSDMDRGYSNIFTGIYGGKECGEDPGPFASITAEYSRKPDDNALAIPSGPTDLHGLSPEAWSASSGELAAPQEATAQSVLSYSGDSVGSAEDNLNSFAEASVRPDDLSLIDPFHAMSMPPKEEMDEFAMANGWDRRLAV